MRRDKYVVGDKVITVVSSVPQITVVPVGKLEADAIPMTEQEHTELIEQIKESNKNYKDPKQVEIDDLKAEIATLKSDVEKVKLDIKPNKDQV